MSEKIDFKKHETKLNSIGSLLLQSGEIDRKSLRLQWQACKIRLELPLVVSDSLEWEANFDLTVN